ncbi:FtsQ-type POTRA domain-containing protein [Candidatus Haliotispira prima]|uniref:FtsQ-type POTRA domain-containing protein n=1 Tax=Candidatus Haliotispira prima TaxID=3034016 RepID=A0ABY8MIV0_9SPIO|nr:FtsQ-type POTRA domain-containing protein [Candidatus Haliotispira prima]
MRSYNPRHYLLYMNFALLLILLLEISFYFFIFPRVAVTKIELDSDLALSDEDVRELLDFHSSRNFYSVDLAELERHARSFALVEDIRISKDFPDRLKVWLKSRKPVLVMLQKLSLEPPPEASSQDLGKNSGSERGDRWQSVPVLVDAEGVMFQIGLGSYDDVPVLSGLEFSRRNPLNSLNSRLPSRLHLLVAALGKLQRERPELYALVSEVRVQMDVANLETDIYLEDKLSYIKTGGKIDVHIIETALIALEVLRRSNESTAYLDMRTTGIVYRPEGGTSGRLIPVLSGNGKSGPEEAL